MYADCFNVARYRSACAGSLAILALSLSVALVPAPAAHAQLVTYGPGPGGIIPDSAEFGSAAALAGISSTIAVSDTFTIASFGSVTITGIQHRTAGDVVITLSHGGVNVDILDRVLGDGGTDFGDNSDLFATYTFQLGAADINAAAAEEDDDSRVPAGVYAPYAGGGVTGGDPGGSSSFTGLLSDFAGQSVQGDWILNISDRARNNSGFDISVPFSGWSFSVNASTVSAAAPEPGSLALLALTGVPLVGSVIRRRRTA